MTPAALWTAAVATAAAILSFDLLLPLGAAGGVPYVLLVLLALKSPSRKTALGLAAAGSVLTVVGFFLSEPGAMLSVALTNRALALFAIWISVLPVVRFQRARFGGVTSQIDVEDIMNSVMEAVIISDDRGIMLATNKSAESMFGYKANELVGKSVAVLRPEPERTQHQKQIDKFARTKRKVFVDQGVHQERGVRKDGSIFPMEMQVGELRRNGRRLFVGTTRDVSALRESEERFTKAFQVSPLMTTLLWLEDGRRIDVNDAWLEGTGYSREAIVGQTSDGLALWVDPDRRVRAHEILRETGSLRGFEAQWRKRDGSIIHVLLNSERLELDGKQAVLSIARDVTEERRVENSLRESEERFSKAFQSAPLMMCLMNLESLEYLDVNDAWLKGVGQRREKIIGQTSVEFPLWVSETQRAKAHKELKKTGSLRGFETKWRRTDNSIFDVRIQAERLDIDGKPAILSIARDVTEEKRAEQALRQSEARFRDVAEISSDWIWETDANNRISYISDRVRDALGFDPKVVIGSVRGTSDRIADRGSETWQRHLSEVEARRPFTNFVYQHYDREGGIRHIQISGKPVFGEDGEFTGYRGVGADITAQREVEMAKARAEKKQDQIRQHLQAIMDNVLEGIVTIDERGIIESINPAGEELFGYAGEDLVGQNVSMLMPAGHRKKHDGYLSNYFRTGERRILEKPRELFARRRDGSEFPIELRVSQMQAGDSRKFVGAIRDLTERKNSEQALRHSEKYLRALIEHSSDVISIVDADGMIRFESPAIERISGLTRAELKGYHVADRAHYDDRAAVRAAFSRVVEEPGRVEVVEYRARHKNGTWHTIESIGKNMLDNPVINGVIITSRDITEHKQAQDALRTAMEEAEYANRSKTEFLANMSHELRTPLNAVIGFAGMIEKELYGPLGSAKYKESAAYIDESATHLLSLINDLLDVSKIEVGKMDMFEEEFDVGATVEQILPMIEPRTAQAGVSVEIRGFTGLPWLHADRRMLKQIILNLMSNAVKFTPRGGSVVVGAEVDRSGRLAITVRDTGIGMAEEDIPTALAAFGQIRTGTEPTCEGTGLGLPLTKSLIEMHGGEIEIDSTVGVGTAVTVRYPASRVLRRAAEGKILRAKAS